MGFLGPTCELSHKVIKIYLSPLPNSSTGQVRGGIVGGSPCFRRDLIREPQVRLGVARKPLALDTDFQNFSEDPS